MIANGAENEPNGKHLVLSRSTAANIARLIRVQLVLFDLDRRDSAVFTQDFYR